DDKGEANTALQHLLAKYPRAPKVYDMIGNLAFVKSDSTAARKAWDRALELDPNDVDALGGISSIYASANKPASAWTLVEARIKTAPNNPGLLRLGAKVRIINRDTKGAEDLLKRSLAADPSNLDSYGLLGRIYVA